MTVGGRPASPQGPCVAAVLAGRDREIGLIASFLGRAATDGGALLLSGEPGVGKTALLDAAAQMAATSGTRVLRAAGAESGTAAEFTGLSQLLRPVFAGIGQLDYLYRQALSVALGLRAGPPGDRLVVANAVCHLLRRAGAERPVLMVVDDLPRLDPVSATVLGFAARRLDGSRVGLLAASRTQEEGFFESGGLPAEEIPPLDDAAAAVLIGARFPELADRVRGRLLAEAQGNPLALLELPAALSGPQRAGAQALPTVLPLTGRLLAVFAAPVSDLPAPARHLLLLAALDATGDLHVLQAASGKPELDDLAPAERARLVYVQDVPRRLVFRHPLTRSAVVALADDGERRRAHLALAELSADQPERRVWHLAEAAVRPDEEVAGQLENAARRILRRGDSAGAVTALLRAADLSPHPRDRSRRLAGAASIGAEVTGDLRSVQRLLDDARRADPEPAGSLAAAVAVSYLLLNGEGDIYEAYRLLADAIAAVRADGYADDGTLAEALFTLLLVCFSTGRAEHWESFDAAMTRLAPRVPADLALLSKTLADPVRAAVPALGEVDAAILSLAGETDPVRIVRIAIAADFVDRLAGCRDALLRVVRDGRAGGAVTLAIKALDLLCMDAYATGQWDEAQRLVGESLRLCEAHGYPGLVWPGLFGKALLAAARGHHDTARALTGEMTRWALPRRRRSVQVYACHVQALAALGQGDFETAYRQAAAISPAGVFAPHVPHALRVAMDLVEAAVRAGRRAEAASHVAAMRDAGIGVISSRLTLITAGSAAIAAEGAEAKGLFEEALAVPAADRWPFDLARVQLAYGEWLRRARAMPQARGQLTAALDTFRQLGARPWEERAAQELRAAGQAGARAAGAGPAALSPQELEIATLAAGGLTNKEIGERLFMSHRTVAAHLYQIFPKLGITSRAALRDALGDPPFRHDVSAVPPQRKRTSGLFVGGVMTLKLGGLGVARAV